MRLVASAAVTRLLAAAAMVGMLGSSAAMAQGQRGQMDRSSDQESGVTDHVQTVNDLAGVCDPQIRGLRRLEAIAYCQGYLTAAAQYHALLYPAGGPARQLFCVPSPGPSIAETGISFARWARNNPSRANEPALDGFLRWAQERFPCEDDRSPRRNRGNR